MGELDHNQHSVYLMYYHLIMMVKYRRKVIDDDISERAEEIFEYIGKKFGITLEEWNHDVDHVHVMFRTMLSYKLEEQGKEIVKVDRFFPSSKRCSCCWRIKDDLKLADRVYTCECGNLMGRDVNAAVNIRMEAMRLKAS